MTAQEIFTKAVTHLLTQNKKSVAGDVDGYPTCMYRGPNGLKCAVGPFIDDRDYTPEMEGKSVASLIRMFDDAPSIGALEEHVDMLGKLQHVHDSTEPGFWREELKKVARHFRLEMPEGV